jgi:hypothetical protein
MHSISGALILTRMDGDEWFRPVNSNSVIKKKRWVAWLSNLLGNNNTKDG